MTTKWERIGAVSVEGGTLHIKEFDLHASGEWDYYFQGYEESMETHDRTKWVAGNGYVATKDGTGLILNGFGGDGLYDVFVKRDALGFFTQALIKFQ